MKRFSTFALTIALLSTGTIAADEKTDLARFQGAWAVTRAVQNGVEAPDVVRVALHVNVTGRMLTIRSAENVPTVLEAEISLDPTKTPAWIELKSNPSKTATVLHGIYQFDGETVRLSWSKNGSPRPVDFASTAQNKVVFFELKRVTK